MANKYFSAFSDRKITAPTPARDERGVTNPPYPERTFPWAKDIGPSGPKRNTVGFEEVKAYPAQKLADDKGKIHKVMKEFKEGELHSGSKRGPKARSRDQAVAIAMSEAGMSKKHRRMHKY